MRFVRFVKCGHRLGIFSVDSPQEEEGKKTQDKIAHESF